MKKVVTIKLHKWYGSIPGVKLTSKDTIGFVWGMYKKPKVYYSILVNGKSVDTALTRGRAGRIKRRLENE